MFKKSVLNRGLVAGIVLSAGVTTQAAIESFEQGMVPQWMKGGRNSFSFTRDKSQHGDQSLVWTWQKGEAVTIDTKQYSSSIEKPTDLMVWVYNETSDGALDISWGNGQTARYELNFTGWRSLWIRLNFDGLSKDKRIHGYGYYRISGMGVPEDAYTTDVNTIRIRPTASSGQLLFDMLEITDSPIPHDRMGNSQQSYVLNDPSCRHNYPWIANNYKRNEELPQVTAENLAHYERIEKSIGEIFKGNTFARAGKAQKGFKDFQERIRVENGKVRGPHVSTHIVERYYRQNGREGIHLTAMQGSLYHIALQYEKTGDTKWKDLYFDYLDFQHEKGFAAGSGMMNLVFVAKNASNYVGSLLIMRPHFDSERWDREAATLRWISGYNNLTG